MVGGRRQRRPPFLRAGRLLGWRTSRDREARGLLPVPAPTRRT